MNLSKKIHLYALLSALIAFIVYLKTLCPTVYSGDSGELCTAAFTLSIAHPPGYPLYTLIGWVFSHLPFGDVAYLMNLAAAIFSAISVYFAYLTIENISRKLSNDGISISSKIIPGLGALIWGLS
jgi:hypothetical protein